MPLEIGSVCQHADARRAMLLVGPRYGDGVEISPDQASGGAGLLDLGNELDWPGPGQGCAKVADRWGLSRLGFQLLQGHPPARCGNLLALCGDDLVEYGCLHGLNQSSCPRLCRQHACVFEVHLTKVGWALNEGGHIDFIWSWTRDSKNGGF